MDGVPSPLGQSSSSVSERQKDPLARTAGATPNARDNVRRSGFSQTEAVAVSDEPNAPPLSFEGEEDDEDEMATLVANSPHVVNSVLASLGKPQVHDVRNVGSADDEPDSETLSKTNAIPRGELVSLDDIEGGQDEEPARPTTPWDSQGARRPIETGEPVVQYDQRPPVFDVHSNPAAETMQLRAVRPTISTTRRLRCRTSVRGSLPQAWRHLVGSKNSPSSAVRSHADRGHHIREDIPNRVRRSPRAHPLSNTTPRRFKTLSPPPPPRPHPHRHPPRPGRTRTTTRKTTSSTRFPSCRPIPRRQTRSVPVSSPSTASLLATRFSLAVTPSVAPCRKHPCRLDSTECSACVVMSPKSSPSSLFPTSTPPKGVSMR